LEATGKGNFSTLFKLFSTLLKLLFNYFSIFLAPSHSSFFLLHTYLDHPEFDQKLTEEYVYSKEKHNVSPLINKKIAKSM
jgi:hypothetical protein